MSGELQPYDTDPLLAHLHARLQTERNALPAASPEEVHRVLRAIASYDRAMSEEFGREHDHFRLLGQDNIRRYLPVGALRVRIHPADSLFDVVARVCAAQAAGCRITVSVPSGDPMSSMASLEAITRTWGNAMEVLEESDTDFVDCMVQDQRSRGATDQGP